MELPKPLFPEFTQLDQVFVEVCPWDEHGRLPRLTIGGRELSPGDTHPGEMVIGNYVIVRAGDDGPDGLVTSIAGRVTDQVAKRLKEVLVYIDNDTLHFQVIVFDDYFRVWVNHGQIIGSRYLCELPLSELPEIVWDRDTP